MKTQNQPDALNNEEVTLEEAVEILLTRLDELEERLDNVEEILSGKKQKLSLAPTVVEGERARHKRYRLDPFHGLFGYYFVLGMLLFVCIGIVLTLTSSDSLYFLSWISAIILTLFQMFFLSLGIWFNDRRTSLNAAIGLILTLLIDLGVIHWIPFPF